MLEAAGFTCEMVLAVGDVGGTYVSASESHKLSTYIYASEILLNLTRIDTIRYRYKSDICFKFLNTSARALLLCSLKKNAGCSDQQFCS